MDSFSFFVGTRTENEIYEIMHMHLFGFSVGKVEVPAQPDFPQAYLNADQDV